MRYFHYEDNKPNEAIIKAKDEDEALQKYMDYTANIQDSIEEVDKEDAESLIRDGAEEIE